jgi:hypothetical protein
MQSFLFDTPLKAADTIGYETTRTTRDGGQQANEVK